LLLLKINLLNRIKKMYFKSIKHLTLVLVLPIVSLGILTACVQGRSETATADGSPLSKPNMILNVKRSCWGMSTDSRDLDFYASLSR